MGDMSIHTIIENDSDERETPPELFRFVETVFGPFDLDVCATAANAKCASHYTIETNGLVSPWQLPDTRRIWCNPPYSDIFSWVMKTVEETVKSPIQVVMLIPAAPETKWFAYLMDHAIEVAFLAPRVRFLRDGEQMGSPPFGSALAVFGRKLTYGTPMMGVVRWK